MKKKKAWREPHATANRVRKTRPPKAAANRRALREQARRAPEAKEGTG